MTLLNDYIVLGGLGKGTYGSVKLCYNMLDDALYALKVRSGGKLAGAQLAARRTGGGVGCAPLAGGAAAAWRVVFWSPPSGPQSTWPLRDEVSAPLLFLPPPACPARPQILQRAQLRRQMLGPRRAGGGSSHEQGALDMLRWGAAGGLATILSCYRAATRAGQAGGALRRPPLPLTPASRALRALRHLAGARWTSCAP